MQNITILIGFEMYCQGIVEVLKKYSSAIFQIGHFVIDKRLYSYTITLYYYY